GGSVAKGAGSPDDIHGQVDLASSHNLVGVDTGLVGIGKDNQIGSETKPIDPRLTSLDYHGGLVRTYALRPDSPALDGGDNAHVVAATDARGAPRICDGAGAVVVDIGAFESTPALVDTLLDDVDPTDWHISLREALLYANSDR